MDTGRGLCDHPRRAIHTQNITPKLRFDGRSDIDLAVRSIPAAEFYRAYAAATAVSPQFDLDLIDLDACPQPLREAILKEGRPL